MLHLKREGFILLELLIAILILEVGVLGIAELYVDSIQVHFDAKQALQALQLLRGEMEKIEKADFFLLKTQAAKVLSDGFVFTLNVEFKTPIGGFLPEHKIATGKVVWNNIDGAARSYSLVTSRWNPVD